MDGVMRDRVAVPARVMCNRRSKVVAARSSPSGISPEDLAAINVYAVVPLTADQVIVRRAYLAND